VEKEVNERMTRRKRERVLSNCGMCRSSRVEKCAIEGLREWDILTEMSRKFGRQ